MSAATDLEARIDRLESLDAIRQLPAKYALALDMRDMDAMVSLFPADVRVGREASGRLALREYMDRTLRSPFTGTSHTWNRGTTPPTPSATTSSGSARPSTTAATVIFST